MGVCVCARNFLFGGVCVAREEHPSRGRARAELRYVCMVVDLASTGAVRVCVCVG